MNKFFLGLFLSFALLFLLYNFSSNERVLPSPSPKEKTQRVIYQFDLTFNEKNYKINWAEVTVPKNITLGGNLEEKKSAKSIFTEKQCKVLTNGGFYTEENDYIGLVYVDGKKLSNESKDSFFNGVFYITKSGEVGIGSGVPLAQIKHAIQSGPILVRYHTYQKLKINSDENKRRMIVAANDKNEVIFLTIYDPVSGYLGPKLAEAPDILQQFAKGKEITIVDALNLDGGSASAFYTEGVALGEITHIGSYLCAQ